MPLYKFFFLKWRCSPPHLSKTFTQIEDWKGYVQHSTKTNKNKIWKNNYVQTIIFRNHISLQQQVFLFQNNLWQILLSF